MDSSTNVAIYARHSSLYQRSVEDQVRICSDFAASKGWTVHPTHIYRDVARSGTEISSREALKEMLRMAISKGRPFGRILVDDTSRIARNTREALEIFALLDFYDIRVSYISQGIDTGDEIAEDLVTVNAFIDSKYIRHLAKKTHDGVEGQVLKGRSGGGKRYGYRSEPILNGKADIYGQPLADGYLLKINVEEAETLKRIFVWYSEGKSAKKIVDLLNDELAHTGKPKPPRGKYWSIHTIIGNKKAHRGLLNDELYIGVYWWNRSYYKKDPRPEGKKKRVFRNASEWIRVVVPELRIIEQLLWDKAKARQREVGELSNGHYRKTPAYSAHFTTGLIKCEKCMKNIVIVYGGKWPKCGCSTSWHCGGSACRNDQRIERSVVENMLINAIDIDLLDSETVDYITKKVSSILLQKQKYDTASTWKARAIQDQLRRTDREINNFLNALRAGIITQTVKASLEGLEKQREDLNEMLLKAREETIPKPSAKRQTILHYLSDLPALLRRNPIAGRGFLSTFFYSVTMNLEQTHCCATVSYRV